MINRWTNLGLARHSTLSRVLALAAVIAVFSLVSFRQTVTATLPTPLAPFVAAVNPVTNKTNAVDGAEMVVIDGATHPASPERFASATSPKVPRSPARGAVPPSALPPNALPTISAALGAHDPGYGIRAHGRALRARNSRQGLAAEFSSDGVVVTSHDASLRMKFAGYGSGKDIAPARAVRPIARDNRIEYRRGSLTEWYVNGPAGLEQGFTLKAPPKRQAAGPLQIALGYSGDLQPELEKNGEALVLKRGDGSTALRYTGLEAHDADGHALHASMELRGNSFRLLVDDQDARYPVVVDPLFQAAILTPSNGTKIDGFGSAVAVSGDGNTIVVGAPNSASREAYVFEKQGAAWTSMTEVRRLSDPDSEGIGALAITDNGDTILSTAVALLHEDVFVRPGTSWSGSTDKTPDATLTQTLQASNVAISGDGSTVVVEPTGTGRGGEPPWQLLVFLRPGDAWSGTVNPAATLTGSDPNLFNSFGVTVAAIDFHANVIVGDAAASPDGEDTFGEVLVFTKPEGGWTSETETAILKPNSSTTTGNDFGRTVAISNDGSTILAGDPFATVNSHFRQGEAYVFVQPADAAWTSTDTPSATLFDTSGAADDTFGSALAISGDANHILVGVPTDTLGPGRVSTFDMPAGGWTGTLSAPENLTASDSTTEFGISVSINRGATSRPSERSLKVKSEKCTYSRPASVWIREVSISVTFSWELPVHQKHSHCPIAARLPSPTSSSARSSRPFLRTTRAALRSWATLLATST